MFCKKDIDIYTIPEDRLAKAPQVLPTGLEEIVDDLLGVEFSAEPRRSDSSSSGNIGFAGFGVDSLAPSSLHLSSPLNSVGGTTSEKNLWERELHYYGNVDDGTNQEPNSEESGVDRLGYDYGAAGRFGGEEFRGKKAQSSEATGKWRSSFPAQKRYHSLFDADLEAVRWVRSRSGSDEKFFSSSNAESESVTAESAATHSQTPPPILDVYQSAESSEYQQAVESGHVFPQSAEYSNAGCEYHDLSYNQKFQKFKFQNVNSGESQTQNRDAKLKADSNTGIDRLSYGQMDRCVAMQKRLEDTRVRPIAEKLEQFERDRETRRKREYLRTRRKLAARIRASAVVVEAKSGWVERDRRVNVTSEENGANEPPKEVMVREFERCPFMWGTSSDEENQNNLPNNNAEKSSNSNAAPESSESSSPSSPAQQFLLDRLPEALASLAIEVAYWRSWDQRRTKIRRWLLDHRFQGDGSVDQKRYHHDDGHCPLHDAVVEGDGEMVKLLLQAGANPNQLNKFEMTPLDLAHWHRISAERTENLNGSSGGPGPGVGSRNRRVGAGVESGSFRRVYTILQEHGGRSNVNVERLAQTTMLPGCRAVCRGDESTI